MASWPRPDPAPRRWRRRAGAAARPGRGPRVGTPRILGRAWRRRGGEAFDLRDGLGYSAELYRPTISLRAGGTPSRYLRLGGEILGWIDDHDNATESLTSLLFIAQLYPAPATGLYLKGGLGLGRNEVDFHDGFGVGDTGFAGLLGAGWELRVGRRLYLNPAIDLVQHRYTGPGR